MYVNAEKPKLRSRSSCLNCEKRSILFKTAKLATFLKASTPIFIPLEPGIRGVRNKNRN